MSGPIRTVREAVAATLGALDLRVSGSLPETIDPPELVVDRVIVEPSGSMGGGYRFTIPVIIVGSRADRADATDYLDELADAAWHLLTMAGYLVERAEPAEVDGNGARFPAYTLAATAVGLCP